MICAGAGFLGLLGQKRLELESVGSLVSLLNYNDHHDNSHAIIGKQDSETKGL